MLILATLCFLSLFEGYQSAFCLNYDAKESIEIEQLNGQWWEYYSFNVMNPIEPNGYDCSVFNFYPENGKMNMWQDYIRRTSGIVNKDHTRSAWKIPAISPGDPDIKGNFDAFTKTVDGLVMKYKYTVIETDYKSWLFVTVCNENAKSKGAYVLTRSQNVPVVQAEKLEKNMQETMKYFSVGAPERDRYTIKENTECKSVYFPDTM